MPHESPAPLRAVPATVAPSVGVLGSPARPASESDPVRIVLRHLRGRIPIAVALGIVLAAAGAVVPWLVMGPVYEARGLIRVAPTGQVILFRVEDNLPLPHYDSFVNTQVSLITSRRILAAAMESPRIAEVDWPRGEEGVQRLRAGMRVIRARGAEIISVTLQDKDPRAAAAALNAVLEAYRVIQIEGAIRESQEQERLLQGRLEAFTVQMNQARTSARNAAHPVTPEALQRMLDTRTADLASIKTAITEARMREAEGGVVSTPIADLETIPVDRLTDSQITLILARRDPTFAAIADLRSRTELELLVLSSQVGPQHRTYTQKAEQLRSLTERIGRDIATYREDARAAEAAALAARRPDQPPPPPPMSVVERLEAQRVELEREIETLAISLQNIQKWLDDAAYAEAEAVRARERLEQLRFERRDQSFGRITIEETASVPIVPATDRRLPLSAAAAVAGMGGGIGIVVLFGLLRPAVRYSDDAQELKSAAPLLAAIPDVSSRDPEDRQTAAFCVHHLRHLVEAALGQRGPISLAVTSPGPGDGKTQLTLGLAASMASAGRRVVTVDLDFIGRGLTRATETGACVGLAEHLAGSVPLEDCVLAGDDRTPFAVLPAGQPEHDFAATLDAAKVRSLIARLSERFDVVILDTGPILGSLEASAVVASAGSTLVVVGRGQRASLVQAAVTRVRTLGGSCLGLVFNRAGTMDVSRSVGSVSLRSAPQNGAAVTHRRAAGRSSLYQAVAGDASESADPKPDPTEQA